MVPNDEMSVDSNPVKVLTHSHLGMMIKGLYWVQIT